MLTWREFRISREGRRGFLLSLPCFQDDEEPEEAERMNRFYESASRDLYAAALDAVAADARRIFYRCLFDAENDKDGTTVTLRLSLSVSGRRTRRKIIVHRWGTGGIVSKTAYPLL